MSWQQLKDDAAYLDANITALDAKGQEFARSLLDQFHSRGLSAKQEYWVGELATRARKAVDAKTRVVEEVKIDLSPIVVLFRKASTNLKKPYVLVDDLAEGHLRLKLAGPGSKYAGQVYVYSDGAYEDRLWLGRVDPERCVYVPSRDAEHWKLVDNTQRALVAFAADPVGAATRYGRTVGACCFCSRQLNDPRSITVGYGPICAEHFGLPWGEVVEVQDFAEVVADGYDRLGAGQRVIGVDHAKPGSDRTVVEYAGFSYEIVDGEPVPLPGQHAAASKQKHIMAVKDELQPLRDRKKVLERKAWENRPGFKMGDNDGVPFDDEIPF